MPLSSVQKFPGEPILVSTFTGHIALDDIHQSADATAACIQEVGGPVHGMAGLTTIDGSLTAALLVLRAREDTRPGGAADPNVLVALVGSHTMVKLYADAVAQPQFGGIHIPMFKTVEDALAAARIEV